MSPIQFDATKDAVINPAHILEKMDAMPETAIACFAHTTFNRLVTELNATQIATAGNANYECPIYQFTYQNQVFALFMALVGAPACVGLFEDVHQLGVKKFIVFGTCGVLDSAIDDCQIIIPTHAIREEGTSYHYLPASSEIEVNLRYQAVFMQLLKELNFSYHIGKVWTTDAFYRETANKIKQMRQLGVICVDMECSALAALAQFRQFKLFHFFYAADNLADGTWDARSLSNHSHLIEKDRIGLLAVKFAKKIHDLF